MLKSIVKYLISSLLAAGLLYWAFSKSELHYNDILLTFQRADYNWVAASVIIAIISHLLRALRWEQLLGAMSYHPGTVRTFSAVLIGYFANFYCCYFHIFLFLDKLSLAHIGRKLLREFTSKLI